MRDGWAIAAAGCWALALGLVAAFRLSARMNPPPGDDTPFTLLMLVPLALLAGAVLSLTGLARRRSRREPLLAALILNGGLLAFFVLAAGWSLATYSGR